MPIYCQSCNQFFVDTDNVIQVIEVDKYGHKEYVYYHKNHCPKHSKKVKEFTGKDLLNTIFNDSDKRLCNVCGKEIESTRPDTLYCKHCSRVRAYKTPEFKRAYMRSWRLKDKERKNK